MVSYLCCGFGVHIFVRGKAKPKLVLHEIDFLFPILFNSYLFEGSWGDLDGSHGPNGPPPGRKVDSI